MRKINIDTDLRMALSGSMRQYLLANPASFDLRAIFKPGITKIEALCIERFERFGTAGNSNKIKTIPLHEMAQRYLNGFGA